MERLEFLHGAKRDMETWTCGICKDSKLDLKCLTGNQYEFSCPQCKNTLRLEMVWLSHDYYSWPEDTISESELIEKLAEELSPAHNDVNTSGKKGK